MDSIFRKRDLIQPKGMEKLFRKNPRENFLIETENLLNAASSMSDINEEDIIKLAEKYKISLERDFIEERKELLSRLMAYFLKDNALSSGETDCLKKLGKVLCLTSEQYNEVYRLAVKNIIEGTTAPVFESHLFSPEDEKHMMETAKAVGVSLKFPADVQRKLDFYRKNWQLLNYPLPSVPVNIQLQSGEKAHYYSLATWNEERTVTQRINYSGFTYSTKVFGNIRWKAGTVTPHRIQSQEMKEIDSGTIFITNKRIIFTGMHGNKIIPLNKLLTFEAYSDGVMLQKESGKSPFIGLDEMSETFAIVLSRALENSSK